MGWLRDLMVTSDPPVASFGRLAEAALAHPSWPTDTQPKPRSLATLFSKLDRDQELEWLADRPEVQRVLSELMRRPLGDLQQALPSRRPLGTGRLLPLTDVRFARELDLTKERLCPGIPDALYEPSTWGALLWHAPSGSGRSLVGAWLTARGLATHVTVEGSLDRAALPPRGPLFVELVEVDGALDLDAWYEALGAARRPVCIAGPMPLPEGHTRFRSLSSPSVSEVLPELVDWVDRRLSGEGSFDAERALLFMRRVALPSGAVTALGDAVGILGMLDEVRPRTLSGRSLDEIAESFVRSRIDESSRESTAGTWLNRNAFPALLGTIAQLVTESDRSPSAPRTFDEWLELVPHEHRRGVDVEWMRTALGSSKSSQPASKSLRLRSEDVVRAARKLPPGGYQLLRAFEHARLLIGDGERLRLRPQWLATLLHARATDEVLATSPVVWGETLLRPAHAARTMRSLWSRALRGKLEPLFAALELDEPENPACVVALEAAATVAGLALLSGASLPSDLVSDLWTELRRGSVSLPGAHGLPSPRLPHPESLAREEPLLAAGAWLVAYLALSERAETASRRGGFDPFRAEPSDASRRLLRDAVYPRVEAFLEQSERVAARPTASAPEGAPWVLGAYVLIDRLRRSFGPAAELPRPLELPSAVCAALERGAVDVALVERLASLPHGFAALGEVARGRGTPFSALSKQLWASLAQAATLPPALDPESAAGDDFARALWSELPVEVLRRRLLTSAPLPWPLLLPHHFAAALAAGVPLPADACEHAPRAALFEALEARGLGVVAPASLPLLFRKSPREMLALVGRRLDARKLDGLDVLLFAATREHATPATTLVPELVRLLTTRADVTTFPREDHEKLRAWIADCVARRLPGWRDAYPLFHSLERGAAALRRAPFAET